MKRFVYRRSILNVAVLIWLILGIIFLIELSEDIDGEQGQGMSISLMWIAVAVVGMVIDLVLQYFISKRSTVNVIGGLIVAAFIILIKLFVIG